MLSAAWAEWTTLLYCGWRGKLHRYTAALTDGRVDMKSAPCRCSPIRSSTGRDIRTGNRMKCEW